MKNDTHPSLPAAPRRVSPHALMLLNTVLVATSFPVVAGITREVESLVLVLMRFTLAAILFLPIVLLRGHLTRPSLRDLGRYAILGACLALFFWSMFEALRFTTPLNTAALFTLVPLCSAAIAARLVRERLGARRIGALVIAMGGALWVIFDGDPARLMGLALNPGDRIFLIGVVALGAYGPLVKYLHRGEPTTSMTFWTLVTGAGWLYLLGGARLFTVEWGEVPLRVYVGIVYLTIFTTMVTFFIAQHCILLVGPTRRAAYSYLTPALVLGMSWLLGQGAPAPMALPGIAVIIAASLVLQRASD